MDKVQKIREEVEKRYEYWKEKESNFHSIESDIRMSECHHLLLMFDSMQKEPVSEDLEDTTQTIIYNGEVYTRCYKDKLDAFACKYPMSVPKPSKRYAKYSNVDLTIAVKEGAKWQKEHLWKPADGDDLPETDREVIALAQPYPNDEHLRVIFAHRPNKYANVWNSDLGEKQVVEIERHGKGGWNIPDVKWWLDVKLPKEIKL